MNTTIELLFHLDIPLDYYKKLQNYYYIPENKINLLKPSGNIYLVNKFISNKQLYYLGILTKIDDKIICFKEKDPIEFNTILEKYHVFYKPKLNKMDKSIQMLNIINKSIENDI